MNNTQFRRLVLDTPTSSRRSENPLGSTSRLGGATPALGSRMRSSTPMTPRSVAGYSGSSDFARQLAERNAELNPSQAKKFRSSAAPKGTKLREGYQDRTQLRTSGEEDDKAVRIQALEDLVKLGQMEYATFEALRDEIIGGNVNDVHLVKGLDYKLLERVRRGEDVLSDNAEAAEVEKPKEEAEDEPALDVDNEFEKMEEQEIKAVAKGEKVKRGEMAPPPPTAGQKRTRDDILRELKASRAAAAERVKEPQLGSRFVRISAKHERSRIEKDSRGNEILITVDEDGSVKRKVRKAKTVQEGPPSGLLMPDKDVKPLGMEVPTIVPATVEEEDGDIFEGVGVDYNPLGDAEDDDTSDEEVGKITEPLRPSSPPKPPESKPSAMLPPKKKRNYFGEPEEDSSFDPTARNPLTDPTILAALKKAATLDPISGSTTSEEEVAKIARRKKMLEADDRDAEDMDMEFGSSRFGDQDDGEDRKVKLSKWTGGGDGDGEEEEEEKKARRKRGAKKRKGDVNSAADVLGVMERRKVEGK